MKLYTREFLITKTGGISFGKRRATDGNLTIGKKFRMLLM